MVVELLEKNRHSIEDRTTEENLLCLKNADTKQKYILNLKAADFIELSLRNQHELSHRVKGPEDKS
jgi:hypothetical protein